MRIADLREALRYREYREVGRVTVRDLVLVAGAETRASGSGRTDTQSRLSDPWHSGVVEEHPWRSSSTISNWRERAHAVQLRATMRRRAAHLAKVQRDSIRTLMCMPREPLVFRPARSPMSPESFDLESDTAYIGPRHARNRSRSIRNSSGVLQGRQSALDAGGVRYTQINDPSEPGRVSTTTSSAVRPEGNDRRDGP